MTLHLCTYFDHRFLVRGLALHASLLRHTDDVLLWVLCLTPETHAALRELDLPDVRLVDLATLEAFDPELAAARSGRLDHEYYWTCSPCLPRYLLLTQPQIDAVHYVDADLYFFADARLAAGEAVGSPVAITPHRLSPRQHQMAEEVGTYNVGWLSFERGDAAMAVLDWWRRRCLEWCYDRFEPGRYGDQKYLEQFAAIESATRVMEHLGVNAGPWSIRRFPVACHGTSVTVAGAPLVVYHFSRLRRLGRRVWFVNAHLPGVSRRCRDLIYRPYVEELTRIEAQLASRGMTATAMTPALRSGSRRDDLVAALKCLVPGQLARVPE